MSAARVEEPDVTTRTLTAADRCDRCGAQALVITQHGANEMFWCAHHFREHKDSLRPFVVLDHRSMLTR